MRMRRSCLLLLFAAASCSHPAPLPAPVVAPIPTVLVSPWPAVLASARRAADAGNFDEADRILGEFGTAHAGAPEGDEANFWRALLRADPANRTSTIGDQLAAIDMYLDGGPAKPRYAEAGVLRRMVEAIDSTRAMVIAVRAAADARDRAKNDEVKRLSDELEKTVAELERIKRRLMPKPDDKKPPR